jgi:hypothetical protein
MEVDLLKLLSLENTYVIIEKRFKKGLIESCKTIFVNYKRLEKHLSKKLKRKIYKGSISQWNSYKVSIPLDVVYELIDIHNSFYTEKIREDDLKKHIIGIAIGKSKGGTSKHLLNPKFRIKINKKLANLLGHLIADGAEHNNKRFTYANERDELINEVIEEINECFGKIDLHIREEVKRGSKIKIVYIPRIIWIIIKKLHNEFGSKRATVPKLIWESNKIIKASFLRALFDDEGSVYIKEKKIKIKLANLKLISQIKRLLKELLIDTGKIQRDNNCYLINICGLDDLTRYSNLIGFTHKIKRKKLEALLNSYKYKKTLSMVFLYF